MNESAERMKRLLEELQVSANQLANTLGIHPTNIYHILDGRNGISQRLTALITSKFDNINPEWLQKGKGEMYVEKNVRILYEYDDIPLVTDYGYEFGKITIDKNAPRFRILGMNEGFIIIIRDDSMSPEYKPGDQIGGRYVNKNGTIVWGKNYLVLMDGIGFIRQLYEEADGSIKAVAINNKYPDFTFKRESIVQLVKLHGTIHLE